MLVIANTGLYAADVIILSDQSCLSIGNAPKRLQITYNVHIVCIVTQLNKIDLKSAGHHVISVYMQVITHHVSYSHVSYSLFHAYGSHAHCRFTYIVQLKQFTRQPDCCN